jgi:hypothetical protein
MDSSNVLALQEKGLRAHNKSFGDFASGDPSIGLLPGANVDSDWILRKLGTKFNAEVLQKLKKAIYAIGQGGRRWFSGGSELSERHASVILDYLILIELLLQCRDDLHEHRTDLLDCREQLLLQVDRCTDGQPERVMALADTLVERLRRQLADQKRAPKPR